MFLGVQRCIEMSIQIISLDGEDDEVTHFVKSTYIFLDMGDRSAIPAGKRIIRAINGALRRKSVSEDQKEQLRALWDEFKRLIKELT